MARMQAAEMVLQQMEMLDQQVAASFPLAEQSLDIGESDRIDLPALGVVEAAPAPRARMNAAVVMCGGRHRRSKPRLPRASPRSRPSRSRANRGCRRGAR